MNLEDFCGLLQSEMKEKSPLKLETHFKELENYGSLSAVLILDLVEKHFNVKINPRGFRSIATVQDLVDVIGSEKFS